MSDEFFCFDCPCCGGLLVAHMEHAGLEVACQHCGATVPAELKLQAGEQQGVKPVDGERGVRRLVAGRQGRNTGAWLAEIGESLSDG